VVVLAVVAGRGVLAYRDEVTSDDLHRRLAPVNPLTVLVSARAWRAVAYCVMSVVLGVLALVVGVVGFVVLPWVARGTTRLERVRVVVLGLPRLVRGPGGESLGASLAVWGTTVLFGLVDAIIGLPVALVVLTAASGAVHGARGGLGIVAVVFALVMTWVAATIGMYVAWGLAMSQVRTVHSTLRSHPDLSQQVAELTSSRSELVDAFATERQRIERDLHDGAQQHLVVATMRLGEAVVTLDQDPASTRAGILAAQQSVEDALAALRDTVRGLHPQVLTDRGLVAAVHELAVRQGVPVAVEVGGDPRPVPPWVENAAYHVVSEALTNVARHSGATSARLTVRYADTLTVRLADDGTGGARTVAGHGLSGLAERVATVGGTFEVDSPPTGTTITATFAL